MAGCRQPVQRRQSFGLRRFSGVRARAYSRRSSGVRGTRFGFLGGFGFAVCAAAGFEVVRSGVRLHWDLQAS